MIYYKMLFELNKGSLLSEELISFPCKQGLGNLALEGHGVKNDFSWFAYERMFNSHSSLTNEAISSDIKLQVTILIVLTHR